MTTGNWILVAAVVVGVIALIGAARWSAHRRGSVGLQRRFGPEYDRVVASADDRRAAEHLLKDRTRRRDSLDLVALSDSVRLRYADQWRRVQEQFVDRPAEALRAADELLSQVMADRGYPVSDFDGRADLVSVDHPHLVQDYRAAHDLQQRSRTARASTEDLREALLRYRVLFDHLLRPDHPDEARVTVPVERAAVPTQKTRVTEEPS